MEINTQMHKWWCHSHKVWTSDHWKRVCYGQMNHPSLFSLHQEKFMFGETQRSLQSGMPGCSSENGGRFLMRWAAISWYSVGPIITLRGQITASEYAGRLGNHDHCLIRHYF
jgi:hypothetical protein